MLIYIVIRQLVGLISVPPLTEIMNNLPSSFFSYRRVKVNYGVVNHGLPGTNPFLSVYKGTGMK